MGKVGQVGDNGPLILCGTHFNCFLDGVYLQIQSNREINIITSANVSFIKSYNQKIAGSFMRSSNAIPIVRPMDKRFVGNGSIKIDKSEVTGQGTNFKTQVKEGEMIVINGIELKVKSIESDSKLIIIQEFDQSVDTWYTIYPRIDNSYAFEISIQKLKMNIAISLFPEGETHEEPQMIPVKGGIATLVLGCLEQGFNPDIQCYSYYISSPSKFRNKTELILGSTFKFDPCVQKMTKSQAYSYIIDRITQEMKTIMLPADKFEQVELAVFIAKIFEIKNFEIKKVSILRDILPQIRNTNFETELIDFMRKIKENASKLGVSKYAIREIQEDEYRYNLFGGLILSLIVSII